MIKAKAQPRAGEPRCSCGQHTMRHCVITWGYCGRQAVSVSNHWREKLGEAPRPLSRSEKQ